jgi:hypothetical protein
MMLTFMLALLGLGVAVFAISAGIGAFMLTGDLRRDHRLRLRPKNEAKPVPVRAQLSH